MNKSIYIFLHKKIGCTSTVCFILIMNKKIAYLNKSKSDRPSTSASTGIIGSTLAAAGFTLGGPAMHMENIMNANNAHNQESARRSSTPTASSTNTGGGGGFSSIFNLKSVISAATKQPQQQQQTTNSNFYVPPPISLPNAEQTSVIESHTLSSPKSIQGTNDNITSSSWWCVRICFLWCLQFS